MHVGLDLLFLVPEQSGGRETYVRELFPRVRALRPSWQITGFVSREAAGVGWWRDVCDGLVVLGHASGRRRWRWAFGELASVPRAAGRAGVDVLHSPANFGPATGPFARVLTLHDVTWLRVPEAVAPIARALTTAMIKPAARRADRVLVPSQASRDDAIGLLGVAPEKVEVIANGCSAPAGGDGGAGRALAGVPAGTPLVLCIATNLGHKNLPALVAAVDRIDADRRPALVLAGHGTEALGGRPWLHALGRVSQRELEDLYAAADAFVLPTLYEGFGIPIVEALARGVPVACSDVPGLREVADGVAAFFDPRDTAAIAAAIGDLLADGSEIERRRVAGRARAVGYSWDAAADAVVAAYERARA